MNIKITNMDNESKIIISEKDFATCKNLLSENSVYEETDEPTTTQIARKAAKDTCDKILNSLISFIRQEDMYENYRTTIV